MKSIGKIATVLTAGVMLLGTSQFAVAGERTSLPPMTDDYVTAPVYVSPDGRKFDAADGLEVHTGEVALPTSNLLRKTTRYDLGTSYVSSEELGPFNFRGTAYASGRKDHMIAPYTYDRVIQACFKYTRGGKDVIGWQCSNTTAGKSGPVVRKTIWDSAGWNDPKTVFRYSYKTIKN